jgi:hypothetical protein
MDNNIDKKINPQITSMEIGVRDLRKIEVYPLSLGDELKFIKVIGESIQEYSVGDDKGEMVAAAFIANIVEKNLPELISLVTEEVALEEITNEQGVKLGEIIIDVNFGSISKNAKSLFEKVQKVFLPERPSPLSASSMEDIDSTISTKEVTEKGESPAVS